MDYTFERSLLIAIPFFAILMSAEYFYGLWKKKNTYHNLSDALSSVLSGMTFIASNTIGFSLIAVSYSWLHTHFAFLELSGNQWWVWCIAFISLDFISYWGHRWAHENGFLWSMHLIHHTSEHFNLAVALRQNTFKWFNLGSFFLIFLAIMGVPIEVMAIVFPVHYFMQYWYHTEHIGKMGVLEYLIVTPSQHRVHHAINDIYIDKNYGNIFCFDRLFGTFQEEKDDESCVYGCLGPVRTWDPMKIELRYFFKMVRDSVATKNWKDKVRVFTARTGWRPEDVANRWPGEYIEDYRNFQRFKSQTVPWVEWWGFIELLTIVVAAYYLFAKMPLIAPHQTLLFSFVSILLLSINSLARLLEGKQGWFGAVARMIIVGLVVGYTGNLFGLNSFLSVFVFVFMGMALIVRGIEQHYLASEVKSPEQGFSA